MTMIEQVALRLYKTWCEFEDVPYDEFPWASVPVDDKRILITSAVDAIKAMREPTDGMIDAGATHDPEDGVYPAYQAMIDAALEEGE